MQGPIQPESTPPASGTAGPGHIPPIHDPNTTRPRIPDHELLRRIGGGSYGEVWLARNVLGDYRAVKVIYRAKFEHDRPFEREFEGIQKFEPISRLHESQVDILHVGRNDEAGYFYYVMELADDAGENPNDEFRNPKETRNANNESDVAAGKLRSSGFGIRSGFDIRNSDLYIPHTLKLDLHRFGRLPVEECIQIGLALTTALAHLHSLGLVHRDIKPSNIIFVGRVPKLADIGLVASMDATMSFVGTSGFLPPEGPGTPQGDIYSLGKVLYEIGTGKDRHDFPQLPSDLREFSDPDRLVELNEILLKACEPEARRRYHSAEEMHADLALLQRGKSVQRRRALQECWAGAKKIGATAALITLFVTSSVLLFRQSRQADRLSSNSKAAELYQQAIYLLQKLTPDSFQPALADLNMAIKLDPKFVKAYFALFEAYKNAIAVWAESDWGRQYQSHIREIAGTLHNLGADSAEFHTVQSYVEWMAWHFDRAIKEVEQAIDVDPAFARAHQLKGYYVLFSRGDVAVARREYERASQFHSADLVTRTALGHPEFFWRAFTNALVKYQEAVRLEPGNATAHLWLGRAHEAKGRYEEALAEYEKWALLATGDSPEILAACKDLKECLRVGGEPAWRQKDFENIQKHQPPDHYWLASDCVRLGQTNEVIPLLYKAYVAHNPRMTDLLFDEQWDGWRDDPGFKALMTKVGFTASVGSNSRQH